MHQRLEKMMSSWYKISPHSLPRLIGREQTQEHGEGIPKRKYIDTMQQSLRSCRGCETSVFSMQRFLSGLPQEQCQQIWQKYIVLVLKVLSWRRKYRTKRIYKVCETFVAQEWHDDKLRWEPSEYGGVEEIYVPRSQWYQFTNISQCTRQYTNIYKYTTTFINYNHI